MSSATFNTWYSSLTKIGRIACDHGASCLTAEDPHEAVLFLGSVDLMGNELVTYDEARADMNEDLAAASGRSFA